MATTVEFALLSDDPELIELTKGLTPNHSLYWRIAIFCCQQQLEKCIRREAVGDHYDAKKLRARATREAKRDQGHD